MEGKVIQVILSSEAENFVRLQSLKTQQKIAYNIRKLECGVMDKELFKKLDDADDIWEFRTLYFVQWHLLSSFCLLGYRQTNFSGSHSRYNKENLKDSKERDRKGRIYKKRIF